VTDAIPSTFTAPALSANALTGRVVSGGETGEMLRVCLAGRGYNPEREPLERFLMEVHALARQKRSTSVALDVRDVEFFTTSCLRPLMHWVSKVESLAVPERYDVRVQCAAVPRWQTRFFSALAVLADEIVVVTVEGAALS
jgi:hypothetical protein